MLIKSIANYSLNKTSFPDLWNTGRRESTAYKLKS